MCSFLSDRKQRVKLGKSVSNWAKVTAGVPRGTKLGPIFFLVMVTDLKPLNSDIELWKYVDDINVSEVLSRQSNSIVQMEPDHISLLGH